MPAGVSQRARGETGRRTVLDVNGDTERAGERARGLQAAICASA